ncbi:hypothetical protein OWV82_011592 [Melia azedarach]|uniref:Uncharacterized protein n=1 Tax=Melia azedarach TaxID=155640 RepID=A0ACC1XZE3_MELAZ|nr:hypothetical protein OWV82_011592 [Melia azedarach]
MQAVTNLSSRSAGAKTHSFEGRRELLKWGVVEKRDGLLQEVKDGESSFKFEFGEETTKWLARVLTCILPTKVEA